MNQSDADEIMEVAEAEGLEVRVRENYSGRGMFGRTTTGLVGPEGDVLDAIALAGFRPSSYRKDQMGKSDLIFY